MRPSPRLVTFAVALAAPAFATGPEPPIAAKRPYDVVSPQGTRSDPYYWLRDDTRSKPDVLDYLKAENAYFEAVTAPQKALGEKIEKELVSRLKQDDSTVPYKDKDYLYYTRFETGKENPIYARRAAKGGAEEILVNANVEGAGKGFYIVGRTAISPDQTIVGFTEDTTGRRQFTLRIRDIHTGKDYPDRISGISAGVAWASDNKTIFYVQNDPVTLLSTRVRRHTLGTPPKDDPLVYEEKDKSFYLSVRKSGDERFVVLELRSTVMSEAWVIDAGSPAEAPRNLAPRARDIHYHVDHLGTRWIIRTDFQAPNYRMMSVEDGEIGDRARWKPLLPSDPSVFIQDFEAFKDYLVVEERSDGLLRIRIVPWGAPENGYFVPADEAAYTQELAVNAEQNTDLLRYTYESLTTPQETYELDMKTQKRTLLKRQPVLGGFRAEDYATERLWAVARDGGKIPVSIVYKKGFRKDQTAPLYQYAYGSYGSSTDPRFDSRVISLVDRGFIYAIAHIRGGQEMGRRWYDEGKLLRKKNTFTDFVDVTDYLVGEKYAAKDKVIAMGGSAGGLLMGAVANMAGEKYRGIVAHVPFVDVVTTMLDETIPLTTNEFDEWGNPREKASYDYMLSYSPYDNVEAKSYPALLVTTGLFDSQVQYFEPAKWVAKLRSTKTDRNQLLLKVNMEAGHGGKSGRFERLHQTATEYAFVLSLVGISE